MKIILTSLLICGLSITAYCQFQVPLWDNTIGGSSIDRLDAVCPTSDGGFLIGGHSNSPVSGDKTEACIGSYDYWIVKTDGSGVVQWNNTIGTTTNDYVVDVCEANDGGFIILGYTSGGISGDKTEASLGATDYWIIKLSTAGSILWQNSIGGSGNDYASEILPVGGGYIISGYSDSGISGDKTEACIGDYDYWIFKINNTGSIVWQFTFGGTGKDYLSATLKLDGGKLLLGGYSYSNIGGDKTENSIGGSDYWVFEIDGSGTILWQNTIGGSGGDELKKIFPTTDGGFILAGNSSSNTSGDKSDMSLNYWVDCCEPGFGDGWWSNSTEFWPVKIDATGNILWENSIGGEASENVSAIFKTADNRIYLIGDQGTNDDGEDYYTAVIDENGYPVWDDRLYGASNYDDEGYLDNGYSHVGDALLLPGNQYLIAGYSDFLAGYDKSENPIGASNYEDYWILKVDADVCSPFPIYTDYDQDGAGAEFVANVCENIPGYSLFDSDDCNDTISFLYMDGTEICDGVDNNCNGLIDEGLAGCVPGPSIINQISVGGNRNDLLMQVIPNESGYIIAGRTASTEGELLALDGDHDYFIAQVDHEGAVTWQQSYGTTGYDDLNDLEMLDDGSYIAAGYTRTTGINGDKTELSVGADDLWILKLDAAGNLIWQNTIGGASNDWVQDAEKTTDGGFVLGVTSLSSLSGDKTEVNYGTKDYWIIKLNSSGIIEWQNSIGGSAWDDLAVIHQTSDGGYIVGGSSQSVVSGQKTSPNYGGNDYWVVKLNSDGSVAWQKSYGGTGSDNFNDLIEVSAGGYLLAGNSESGISAMKSEVSIGYDYWIIKINDAGTIEWEKTIQASENDYGAKLLETSEGKFILAGYTESGSGYDKIEDNIPLPYFPFDWYESSSYDYWILGLDESGNIEWQNNIGGNMSDQLIRICFDNAGDIIVSGFSQSFLSGDKTENTNGGFYEVFEDDWYWDPPTNADFDPWIVVLDYNCIAIPETCNSIDDNCNGLVDDGVIESVYISAAGPVTFCKGSSVDLTADFSGETVQWYKNGTAIPGATTSVYHATMKGTYTASTTSDCGSATSIGIFVNVNKLPPASIIAGGPTTFCEGGSVVLTANTGIGLTYQWIKNGVDLIGATSINYTATTAGVYKCRVIKTATGCNRNSNAITITVPCRTETENSNNKPQTTNAFSIYPNPNSGSFTISIDAISDNSRIEIYNSVGEMIYSDQISSSSTEIELKNISSGIYFVRINDGINYSEQKLIIEK